MDSESRGFFFVGKDSEVKIGLDSLKVKIGLDSLEVKIASVSARKRMSSEASFYFSCSSYDVLFVYWRDFLLEQRRNCYLEWDCGNSRWFSSRGMGSLRIV